MSGLPTRAMEVVSAAKTAGVRRSAAVRSPARAARCANPPACAVSQRRQRHSHGWGDGLRPGIADPIAGARQFLTLSRARLSVLKSRTRPHCAGAVGAAAAHFMSERHRFAATVHRARGGRVLPRTDIRTSDRYASPAPRSPYPLVARLTSPLGACRPCWG